MDLRTELRYPGASAADVLGLAHDREFRAAVCRATLAVDYRVDISVEDAGSTAVTVSRTIPAGVPDAFKQLVGRTVEIVQSEKWAPDNGSGSYTAELVLRVAGQPASMRGSLLVGTDEKGAFQVVQGDVRVSMPFIGRKFESELAKGIVAAARREEELASEWLRS